MTVVSLHPKIEITSNDVYFDDGFFTLVENGQPATGRLTWTSVGGTLRLACNLYRGRAHGLWEQFYENGNLEHRCHYSHRKQVWNDERYEKNRGLNKRDY